MHRRSNRPTLLRKHKVISRARKIDIDTSHIKNKTNHLINNPTGSVLIIRALGGIGDVLMTTPAVRQLKLDYPNCKITYACDRHSTPQDIYYQLLFNAPFIDNIVDARTENKSKYDIVIDITSVCIAYERKGIATKNRIDIFADAIGVSPINKVPFLQLTHREIAVADKILSPFREKKKKIVVLHTASVEEKRSWPIEHSIALIEQLPDVQFLIMDFNNKYTDWHLLPNVLEVSSLGIRDKAALISRADLFVGPDSGPMHIAGALKKQSIVLFGSIPPEARINHYQNHQAVSAGLACSPCWYTACPYSVRCMKDITPTKVAALVKQTLQL